MGQITSNKPWHLDRGSFTSLCYEVTEKIMETKLPNSSISIDKAFFENVEEGVVTFNLIVKLERIEEERLNGVGGIQQ